MDCVKANDFSFLNIAHGHLLCSSTGFISVLPWPKRAMSHYQFQCFQLPLFGFSHYQLPICSDLDIFLIPFLFTKFGFSTFQCATFPITNSDLAFLFPVTIMNPLGIEPAAVVKL